MEGAIPIWELLKLTEAEYYAKYHNANPFYNPVITKTYDISNNIVFDASGTIIKQDLSI